MLRLRANQPSVLENLQMGTHGICVEAELRPELRRVEPMTRLTKHLYQAGT